mmetsp:Transcript_23253/g.36351  ORF Transcript_23253/g.36351 Transcript_23253/m.36351 type:complete len:242 (+) Transcript_23253:933-1658(+)|eukprot:CAMPEP_0184327704 /NCGR_PEP_ID=MMETSP1049-20130417/143232_1 /TAXON_ID=77928 /ORGANISM="Proteomonas sulcata, Strain CCMP704" /LENGTH=241 /DNA_ID=CAMNT_0026649971 /DNA_START=1424 /DNA_END=2149 /DNA_ORIENTATION=+
MPGHVEDRETTLLLHAFKHSGADSSVAQELERRIALIAQCREEGLEQLYPSLQGQQECTDEHQRTAAGHPLSSPGRQTELGAKARTNDIDEGGNIAHVVQKTDTIQGLSLKYGVSTQRIKEANGIFGSTIVQYKTLLIPCKEDAKCAKRKRITAPPAHRRMQLVEEMDERAGDPALGRGCKEEALQEALLQTYFCESQFSGLEGTSQPNLTTAFKSRMTALGESSAAVVNALSLNIRRAVK